jgi:NADH-quinone oxidoreductase subunit L
MTIPEILPLIPALPLLACIIVALTGKAFLKEKSHIPVVLAFAGSFILSAMLLFQVRSELPKDPHAPTTGIGWETTVNLWTWISVPDAMESPEMARAAGDATAVLPSSLPFVIDVTLRADALTCIMLCMVTFISTLVAIYASGYMHGDPGYWRFFTYVALFVFSMTMLVSVSNFALLYVFWEAVGVCSYLLVGFWFEKPEAAAAGKKAFLVNRIGDFGFALGIFLIWTTYGTLNFHDADGIAGVLGQTRLANHAALYVGGTVGTAICLLLLLGACGKSAQFPLHVWLPDAMEGPTPVSALIHAATMVTAGVYMVTRCTPFFFASEHAQHVVAIIGCTTAILAGIIAITQTDLKRVMAYSTLSQLGYMFLGLGAGTLFGITAGMFHLFTHAFFKALLFLASGSVMHAMGGIIDMRRFGGLRRLMPTTHWTFLFGCAALAGMIPFSGFWSKDAILASVHSQAGNEHLSAFAQQLYAWLYCIGMFTAFLTAAYTFRAYFMTFFGEERIPHEAGHHAHESPPKMTIPLVILAAGALGVGAYFEWTHGFANFLGFTPSLAFSQAVESWPHDQRGMHWDVAAFSTLIAFAGAGLAAYLYLGDRAQADFLARVLKPAYVLSYGKFFIDQIYYAFIVFPLQIFAKLCYAVDQYLIDGLVNLIGKIPPAFGSLMRSLQTGMVQFYAIMMVLGLLVLIGTLMWPGT